VKRDGFAKPHHPNSHLRFLFLEKSNKRKTQQVNFSSVTLLNFNYHLPTLSEFSGKGKNTMLGFIVSVVGFTLFAFAIQ
tara:strand:- start:9444 stop:9680 length:237 start_codon:yes stop_codon:yes gene_type:complete